MMYVGQTIMQVITIIAATLSIGVIVKLVFNELNEYQKKQMAPFEKTLQKIMETCGDGLKTITTEMAIMIKRENQRNEKFYRTVKDIDELDKDE